MARAEQVHIADLELIPEEEGISGVRLLPERQFFHPKDCAAGFLHCLANAAAVGQAQQYRHADQKARERERAQPLARNDRRRQHKRPDEAEQKEPGNQRRIDAGPQVFPFAHDLQVRAKSTKVQTPIHHLLEGSFSLFDKQRPLR